MALLAAGLAAIVIRAGEGESKVASRAPTTTSTLPTTTVPGTSTTAAPAPATTQPVPPALAAIFAQIQGQVAQARGLPWLGPLDISVAPDAEFIRQFTAVTQRDLHPDRIRGDEQTYKLLKLIPENTDYLKAYLDLLNGAVLGFYDPKTSKLLVRAGGTPTPYQRITIAHEMDHALTDQHFKFGPATYALDAADKQEQGSAYSGLLEGDAKTLEALWAGKFLSAGLGARGPRTAGGPRQPARRTARRGRPPSSRRPSSCSISSTSRTPTERTSSSPDTAPAVGRR